MAFFVNHLPGVEVPTTEKKIIRENFIKTFLPNGARHLPYWFSFPLQQIERDIFFSSAFQSMPDLYFMVSRGASIHKASGAQISLFFRNQMAQEDFDLYIFDDSYEWCIASTDELVKEPKTDSDFLVIGIGKVDFLTGVQ